jgi:hypothetical protein
MKQMHPKPESVINIPLSGAAKALQPILFKEGKDFCCLLGPNPQEGVFGCGNTPKQALLDWELHLKEHLATAGDKDEVVQHVKSILDKDKEEKPVPKHVQEFYDQFRPVKKK